MVSDLGESEGSMELIFFGVGIGMIISAALVGLGVMIGGRNNQNNNQRELSADLIDDNIPLHRNRNRCCSDRSDLSHSVEEKIMVLNTLRIGSTWYEKAIIDEISDDLIKLSKQEGSSEHE